MLNVFRELLLFGSVVGMGLLPFASVQASHAGSRLDDAGYRLSSQVQVNRASDSGYGYNHSYSGRRHRRHYYKRHNESYVYLLDNKNGSACKQGHFLLTIDDNKICGALRLSDNELTSIDNSLQTPTFNSY